MPTESSEDLLAREALRAAYDRFTRAELAAELDIDTKTLDRWEVRGIPKAKLVRLAISSLMRAGTGSSTTVRQEDGFTFADLFAGIGGTRLGFERAGGRCVFTSEYDKFCVQTYKANFRPNHEIAGDITRIAPSAIPDHDVLVAGFPCQPFSIAGVSKKNALGRAHGFDCETQGTLFFNIEKILEAKKPTAFMLENVRNLKSHDQGKTFQVIMRALRNLGYWVPEPAIIDARLWRPQHRERIFIVGFLKPTAFDFSRLQKPSQSTTLADILHPEDGTESAEGRYTIGPKAKVDRKYVLTKHLWQYLQDYKQKHLAAGHGFGYGLVKPADISRTLSARYYKDGSEILVSRGKNKIPRRLTPRECARLMGFPDSFQIPVSDTQAYKQFGNSVVVPVVEAIAKAMAPHVLILKKQLKDDQISMVV